MEEPEPPRFFHPERSLERGRRNLPHWEQESVVAFVTFRLSDSIPSERLASWENERRRWMVVRGKSGEGDLHDVLDQLDSNQRLEYLREFGRQFHSMLDDCHGGCCLKRSDCSEALALTLRHFDGQRYQLGEFVIMPNHVHLLVAPMPSHGLSGIVKSWKSFSAREINRLTGTTGQVWQRESFDHLVRDAGSLVKFERYIRSNPEKASLRPGEFLLGRGKMPQK